MSIRQGTTIIADTGSSRADKDLSNLTSVGENIANWSSNVTNCITEIPQDIKLELNNGTLTLKAGSKVYVPNGFETDGTTKKFDVVTIASDIVSGSISGISADYMFFLNPSRTGQAAGSVSGCYSGASAPSSPSTGWFWYDTTNNSVKRWSGSAWVGGFSLPFCVVNSGATNINQVFNGFGYIGSTVFALPGVKGLIPNGRNADGTLKNIEITSSQVWTRTWLSNPNYHDLSLATSGIGINTNSYNANENFVYNVGGAKVVDRVVFGRMEYNSSSPWNVTSLQVKTAFHAVDYNDSSIVSGWSMPSSRYIDLTLGASGATYTAPANGWFCFVGAAASSAASLRLTSSKNIIATGAFTNNSGFAPAAVIPVKKGDTVTIGYNSSIDTSSTSTHLYFIYAEGENV